MANYTENLKLELPNGNEFYDIDKFNENFTKIDVVVSNPNLLDNPWFTVNQRNVTTWAAGQYGCDRWKVYNDNGSILWNNSHIEIVKNGSNASLEQPIPNAFFELGKKYTASINTGISLGDTQHPVSFAIYDSSYSLLYSHNFTDADFRLDISSHTFTATETIVNTARHIYFYFASGKTIIYACKIEQADASTLTNDTAPNYQTELLKCQRYFYRVKKENAGIVLSVGRPAGDGTSTFPFIVPTAMRTKPSIRHDGIRIFVNGNGYNSGTLSVITTYGNIVRLDPSQYITDVSGSPYFLMLENGDAYLELSADL